MILNWNNILKPPFKAGDITTLGFATIENRAGHPVLYIDNDLTSLRDTLRDKVISLLNREFDKSAPTICINYMDFELQVYRVFPTAECPLEKAFVAVQKGLSWILKNTHARLDEQKLMSLTRFALNDYLYESIPEVIPVRITPPENGIDFQSEYTDCICDFFIQVNEKDSIFTAFNKQFNEIFYDDEPREEIR